MADTGLVEAFNSSIGTNLSNPYIHVHVLLISWAENDLGAGIKEEILNLRTVFERDYDYCCVSFPIPVDGSQQRRLNTEISNFVEHQSASTDSLIIIYYAGHCSPNAHGQAQWAAYEEGGPTLSWHVAQQLLFSARGDVLLILDCCHASHITTGHKTDGGRFELIAASAIGAKTPVPGRKSFTRALTRVLKQRVAEGIWSESLASELREDSKVTGKPSYQPLGLNTYPSDINLQKRPSSMTLSGDRQRESGCNAGEIIRRLGSYRNPAASYCLKRRSRTT